MRSRLLSIFLVASLLLLSVILYAGTLRGTRGNIDEVSGKAYEMVGMPFESSHERAPYALVLALDRYKQIHLTKELAEFASPDVGILNDKYFILFPPGVSFFLFPFYLLGKPYELAQLTSYASIPLFGLGSIVLLYLLSRKMFSLPIWTSILVPLVYAFATTSWSFTVTIYQHAQTTFFLLLAFYAAYKFRYSRKFSIVWSSIVWFSYGIGLFIDFPSVFLGLPIMIYFFISAVQYQEQKHAFTLRLRPAMYLGSIWLIVLLFVHGLYNQSAFGDWKKFGQSFSRYEGAVKYEQRLSRKAAEATMSGTLTSKPSTGSNPFSVFDEDRVVRGVETLLIADDKGLFYFSPVLLFGVLAWFLNKKKEKLEQGILVSIVLINVVMYASFGDPWGGWAYGPRYLLPTMSVLSIFTGILLYRSIFSWIVRLAFIPIFSFSVAISVLGVVTTNIIPPKVEGIPLGIQYGYVANIFYLFKGVTGVFVYKEWLNKVLTLQQYAAILFFTVVIFAIFLFFIAIFEEKAHKTVIAYLEKSTNRIKAVMQKREVNK